ncbi:hypothetical protein GGF31_006310 [Allomyces arbusculus]|nr:hypothetical protein GGF31_006310 [Allomyces arbusculus]
MSYVDEFGRHRPLQQDDMRDSLPPRRRKDSELSLDDRLGHRGPPRRRSRSPDDSRFGGRLGPRRDDRDHRDRDYARGGDRRPFITADPLTLPYLIDWKTYAGYLREKGIIGERPQAREDDERQYAEILERFDTFKQQWHDAHLMRFFDAHADDPWVLEKYADGQADVRKQAILTMKRLLYTKFEADVAAGKYDGIDLDALPVDEPMGAETDPDVVDRNEATLRTVAIKTVPLTMPRADVDTLFRDLPGLIYVTLSEPRLPAQQDRDRAQPHLPAGMGLGGRTGWAVFDSTASAEAAIAHLKEQADAKANDTVTQLAFAIQSPMPAKYRTTAWDMFSHPDRLATDLETVKGIATTLDTEAGLAGAQTLLEKYADEAPKVHLDVLVTYLRRVHLYCYYSAGCETESPEELAWKCGDKVFRKPGAGDPAGDRAAALLAKFDTKVRQKFDESLRPAKAIDELVDAALGQYVAKEQEHRYRCEFPACGKLFKDTQFVIKHIKNKHAADVAPLITSITERATRLNNFLGDPHHLHPAGMNPTQFTGPFRPPRAAVAAAAAARGSMMPRNGGSSYGRERRDSRGEYMDFGGRDEPRGVPRSAAMDPRGLKSYMDLDAPGEGDVVLDYD